MDQFIKVDIIIFSLVAILTSSCDEVDVPSNKYLPNDRLLCISIDGLRLREDPNLLGRELARIDFAQEVVYIRTVTDEGLSVSSINSNEFDEFWLQVNFDDRIGYVHGGGVRKKPEKRRENPSGSRDPTTLIGADNTNGKSAYIVLTTVTVKKDRIAESESIGEIPKGTVIFSDKEIDGQIVKQCKMKSKKWIQVGSGWACKSFFYKMRDYDYRNFNTVFKKYKNNPDYSLYFTSINVPIRAEPRDNCNRLGNIDEYQFILTDNEINGKEISYCNNSSSVWIHYDVGWSSAVSMVPMSEESIEKIRRKIING